MSHTLMLWEGVIKLKLRKETRVTDNQFDFMLWRLRMEVIYLLRSMMEWYRTNKKDLHLVLIDLEKAYDKVLMEILLKTPRKKEVRIAYISVRTQDWVTNDFPITITLH